MIVLDTDHLSAASIPSSKHGFAWSPVSPSFPMR